MNDLANIRPTQSTARVLKDSITRGRRRLTTVVATFPRSALAEVNTHRAMSRSSASSRAIPADRMILAVETNPYVPRAFSLNQRGMNASEFVTPEHSRWEEMLTWWLDARDDAVRSAERGLEMGVHKQDVNRILEPFMMHTAIISATDWDNFFEQRCALDNDGHPLAYLPFYDLAVAIRDAMGRSTPEERDGDLSDPERAWHTPLAGLPQDAGLTPEQLRKVAVARCARVSYFDIDGVRQIEEAAKDPGADLALYERLLRPSNSSAPHLSPFEHVARAARSTERFGNFTGWRQMRQDIEQRLRL